MENPLARWRDKVALVTGGSSGIGRAIALELGAIGLKVAVAGRRKDALDEVVEAIRQAGAQAIALEGDQTEPDTNRRFFAEAARVWGPVDVLINNSAALGGRSLLQSDFGEIQSALDLNIRAALLCMREAAAAMRGKPDAAIIVISSMTGHRVMPGTPAIYAATKHALRLITDGVRAELTAAGERTKVALISPGLVDTPWHAKPGGLLKEKGAYPYEPLQAADIVAALRYILSAAPGAQVCDIMLRPSGQAF